MAEQEQVSTETGESVTITDTDNTDAAVQGGTSPEDAQEAYRVIIEQQSQNIQLLMEQTQRQQEQIAALLRSGAQIRDSEAGSVETQQQARFQHVSNVYDDFKALGAEIGKRDY